MGEIGRSWATVGEGMGEGMGEGKYRLMTV